MKKWFVIIAIVALLVAHQDYWQWPKDELVYGFLPYNMAYHIVISLVTAAVWILVCLFCWPKDLDSDLQSDKNSVGSDKGGDR